MALLRSDLDSAAPDDHENPVAERTRKKVLRLRNGYARVREERAAHIRKIEPSDHEQRSPSAISPSALPLRVIMSGSREEMRICIGQDTESVGRLGEIHVG